MQGHPSQVRMRMQIQQLEAQVRQSEGRTQRAAADGAQLQLLREADFSRFDALRAQQREEAAADAQRQAKLLAQARTELRRPPHECPRPRFTHTAATHMCSVSPTPTPHRPQAARAVRQMRAERDSLELQLGRKVLSVQGLEESKAEVRPHSEDTRPQRAHVHMHCPYPCPCPCPCVAHAPTSCDAPSDRKREFP